MSEVSLEMIQAMLQRVIDTQRDHSVSLAEHTHRFSHLEAMLANLRREIAVDAEGVAHLSSRVDRLAEEIGRIKRRLDIGDA